ncbi:hypothetical protein Tco_0439764 [Tanacetum coccineum]
MEAPQKTVDGRHRATHHRSRIGLWYPGRVYVSSHQDIFDMVDIDLFTVVAMNMMVVKLGYTGESEPLFYNYLRPLTSLDERLYALAYEEDVRCLATLVRSFKLIEMERQALLMLQRSGVDSSGLSHDESFRVDDLDLNLNEPVNLNVSQVETQSELPVYEEPDVGPTQEPILAEVSTQEPIVAEVSTQEPIVAEVSTEVPIDGKRLKLRNSMSFWFLKLSFEESKLDGEAGFADVAGIKFPVEDVVLEDYMSFGEDAEQGNGQEDEAAPSTDDDDDDDEDFLVDEENEIVEPDVDVHLFGISMDLPFDNIGVTYLVLDDVFEGEDVDVINADSFDSDLSNDDETNDYRRIRRNLKLYKNDSVRIRVRCDEKVLVFSMSQSTRPTGLNHKMEAGPSGSSGPTTKIRVNPDIPFKAVQDQLQRDLEVQISMSRAFRAKAKAEREIKGDHVLQYSMLRDYVVELQSTNPNTTVNIAVERNIDPSLPTRGPFPGQVLAAVGLDSNNGIYSLAYALVEAESRAKSDLLLNNICEVFNGKIVGDGNNAEASGSASRKAQQTEDGSGGSGDGVVIGLYDAAGQGGAGGPAGAGVGS